MARITLVLTVITAVIGLLGGFQMVMHEWRAMRERRRVTGRWFVLLRLPAGASGKAGAQSLVGHHCANRAADWTYAGVRGGIPTRTVICTTLSPGTTTALISSALTACPEGQVVKLNPGTNTLTGTMHPKIEIGHGSGPTQTILNMSAGGANCNPGSLVSQLHLHGAAGRAGWDVLSEPHQHRQLDGRVHQRTSVITLDQAPPVGWVLHTQPAP